MGVGEPVGGNRWGKPPPTRFYKEAIEGLLRGYNGGNRRQRGLLSRL